MPDPARLLFLAGAVPFLVLGTAHAIHTPLAPHDRKGLSPADPAVAEAMTRTRVRLTPHTDLWRAWVGFNFSHSLGAILLGVVTVLVGRNDVSFAAEGPVFVPLAVVTTAIYLALGVRYWFRIPIAGIATALACYGASGVLLLSR